MSKLLGKRWNLRFSILNLLLLMVAASVVIFATVREIHYEKTRTQLENRISDLESTNKAKLQQLNRDLLDQIKKEFKAKSCLLYTSPSPRDRTRSRMPSSA